MVFLRTITPVVLLAAGFAFSSPQLQAQTPPVCQTNSDVDGDGWGWENNRSCRVASTSGSPSPTGALCVDSDGDGYGWDGTATCLVSGSGGNTSTGNNQCIDSDGDGYGWDGTKTCRVQTTNATPQGDSGTGLCLDPDGDGYGWDGTKTCRVQATNVTPQGGSGNNSGACLDPDGDGYGWDGSRTCRVQPTTPNPAPVTTVSNNTCIDPDGDGYGWDGTQTCVITVVIPPTDTSAITDVILMMGQSNALGEDTQVDLSQDDVDPRVIVWTQFDDWQIGNLCTQKWQKAWFPWRGGTCSNHPAFQIAKHIVELDGSRRVAVIPTGTAGKPIRWWDANGIADLKVNATVQTALNSLGRSKVDLVAWSQGEADHGNEVQWLIKLNDLISRIRNRPWFDASQGQFIAQETKHSSVNLSVRQLANDGDPLTDWVQAADQPTKDGVHWSAPAIRTISERFARKYVN